MSRKFGKLTLPKHVFIRDNKYVVVKVVNEGKVVAREQVGTLTDTDADNRKLIQDAEAKAAQIKDRIRTGELGIEDRHERWTMEKACDIFYEKHGRKRPTAYTIKLYLDKIASIFPHKYLDTFTSEDTEKMIETLKADKPWLKDSSVNRYHTYFNAVFNKMREWGEEGKIAKVKLPDKHPGRAIKKADERQFTRRRIVSQDEFYKVYKAATRRLQRNMLMAVNTLLRKNDLKNLTISKNVSWDTHEIVGVNSKVEKTSGEPFTIPFTPPVVEVLGEAEGDRILDFTNHRREFAQAQKEAGVRAFQFKDLRRTGARMLLKSGVDIDTIRQMLGHVDIATTQKYIGALSEDRLKASTLLSAAFPVPKEVTSQDTRVLDSETGAASKLHIAQQ